MLIYGVFHHYIHHKTLLACLTFGNLVFGVCRFYFETFIKQLQV